MLTLEESVDLRRRLEEDRKKLAAIRQKLENETLPQCTVAYRKGKAVVNIGGRDYNPCYYNCSYNFADKNDKFRKQFEKFHENGFRLFGMGISLQRCSVPPETMRKPRLASSSANSLALTRT